jgi:hypothetical protein
MKDAMAFTGLALIIGGISYYSWPMAVIATGFLTVIGAGLWAWAKQ